MKNELSRFKHMTIKDVRYRFLGLYEKKDSTRKDISNMIKDLPHFLERYKKSVVLMWDKEVGIETLEKRVAKHHFEIFLKRLESIFNRTYEVYFK